MLRQRVTALEKSLGRARGPEKKTVRVVTTWDDEPAPEPGPGEALLVVNVVRTRSGEDEAAPAIATPTNGGGELTDDELADQVRALERERDRLLKERVDAER